MSNLYDEVNKSMRRACIAAFLVDPMNPSLSLSELRDLVLQDGYSGPLFDEALRVSQYGGQGRESRAQIRDMDLIALNHNGQLPPQVPRAEALKVMQVFDGLNRQQGINSPKSIEMLAASGLRTEDVRRGLGLLLLLSLAKASGEGFVCQASNLDGHLHTHTVRSPQIEVMTERVRSVFAAREGNTVSSTPPLERFHLLLKKQKLEALAGWWAMTTQELRSLGERHPTASTVLAASMLEAALVAIAEPAMKAGEWRKKELLEKPERWKLGMLIDQAEVGLTLSKNEAFLAHTLRELRNRIHVGQFAVDGPERFKPQFSNPQEATMALKHLEFLLAKILDWPPIAALC